MTFTIGSLEFDVGPSRAGFISVFNKKWDPKTTQKWGAMHFLVWPHWDSYYKIDSDGDERIVTARWVWGRATELYDHNGEYFGLGPLFLMCW